jgi:hypothetical protein
MAGDVEPIPRSFRSFGFDGFPLLVTWEEFGVSQKPVTVIAATILPANSGQ